MVILSRGVPRVVAFQVSWYYTWRGISRTQILTWRCPSCNPVACKSMVTRRIFMSHTLTFVCDTWKLTRVCQVIVELYRISKTETAGDPSGNKIGQKGADGHCGTIKVPTALVLSPCWMNLVTRPTGGHHQLVSSPQLTVNASTASDSGFQNLELNCSSSLLQYWQTCQLCEVPT